ncbi:MAG: hypothetical protein EBV89_11875 [Betaproteobacteria bacterium]|nr:hypothetical protein [Betaproteobacteria bacterium]
MGDTCDNFHAGPHVSGGVLLGYQLHLHRGSQGIDVLTPEVNRAVWTHLISVAQVGTLADLDVLGASIWPQWWPQYVRSREGGIAAVRTALLALL